MEEEMYRLQKSLEERNELLQASASTIGKELKDFAKSQGTVESKELTHWDINLWSGRLRESSYNLNEVISVMSVWTRVQPAYAANMWNEALNKRLGIEDLDLYGILAETERQGITFDQLLTIPEQYDWVYSDGKSTTYVAFILAMYKKAVILGPYANSIQVTEFTEHWPACSLK